MVAVGAAIFIGISFQYIDLPNVDLTRITGQIIVGVGFLGAGVIVKRKREISGLATAAAIWCSAALGWLAALSMYVELAASTLIIVIVNLVLGYYNKKIYKKNKTNLLLSKYGGKLINLFLYAFHEISISDPFTSIKAFDSKLLKSIPLYKKGFDLEFEILTKLKKRKCFFLEVPVSFKPRTSKDGKKITVLEGIKCLLFVIFNKFYK